VVGDQPRGTQDRAVAAQHDDQIDRVTELDFGNDLHAIGRDLVLHRDDRDVAAFAQPRHQLAHQHARLGFVGLQNETNSHACGGTTTH
jgi:hypothetical protein